VTGSLTTLRHGRHQESQERNSSVSNGNPANHVLLKVHADSGMVRPLLPDNKIEEETTILVTVVVITFALGSKKKEVVIMEIIADTAMT